MLLTASQKKVLLWILLLLFTLSSFPFTSSDSARLQPRLGYFYFWRFLLLQGGSNSNWTSTSGLARERQVRARLQMVGGSLRGREKAQRSKRRGFPRWLLSPLFCPLLDFLHACAPCPLPCLAASFSVFLTWSMHQAGAGLPGSGSPSSHRRWDLFPPSSGGQMKSQVELTTGTCGADFFHRSAPDCLLFPACTTHYRPPTESLDWDNFFLCFKKKLLPVVLCKDVWRKLSLSRLMGDWQLVCLKPTWVSWVDRVVWCRKRGRVGCWWRSGVGACCQMLAWLTPSRKYQKVLYEVL